MNDDNKAVWCPTYKPDGSCTKHTGEGIPEMSEKGERIPIDRPCSACSAGDTKMEYHLHQPPFREMSDRAEVGDEGRCCEGGKFGEKHDCRKLASEMNEKDARTPTNPPQVTLAKWPGLSKDGTHCEGPTKEFDAILADAQKEIERLTQDLRLNASMLAKQCDLARDAENKQTASEQREQTMRQALQTIADGDWSTGYATSIAKRALHTEEPHSVSIGVICARWKKLSDGCVARCDKAAGHEGDHVDGVIDIQWPEEPHV